jgi:acetyl-CoA acyltransferase 1
LRTPLTKSKKGSFKDTPIEILSAAVFKGIIEKTKIDPKLIGDVVMGNVLAPGAGAASVRMGMFLAGLPDSVPCVTVDRMCSSGLEAVAIVAAKIRAGIIDIGIGGGVEQMTMYDMNNMVDVNNLSE